MSPEPPPKTPEEGYHFTEDMTDMAITWVGQQKSLMPDPISVGSAMIV